MDGNEPVGMGENGIEKIFPLIQTRHFVVVRKVLSTGPPGHRKPATPLVPGSRG